MTAQHKQLEDFIWGVANKLRGPYRPPQYRRVMLPLVVLRRMDCVLVDDKAKILKEYEKLKAQDHSDDVIHKILGKKAAKDRNQPFYNVSKYDFEKLLADPDNIARNLIDYIQGLSPKAKDIFDKFGFEQEIEILDNANRLFTVIKEFAAIDLHPDKLNNMEMGHIFENLIRRFNEAANEEAGDHFTPREVIRLMVSLIFTGDEDIYKPGISRTIYDPACGTGGMLSVSEEYIRKEEHNPNANITLFGQEYNKESYAICCSDLLIKDEPIDNLIFGDTLGDGKSFDGHPNKKFHYMMANPPFGVEWKQQQPTVEKEHKQLGFKGRFGAGTPRINDGALLFLQHMISKMHPAPDMGGEGSKIAIVFNGSPLFTGDAGAGESNIRRWIIENDLLDAVVALPDQMFYNTGIYTYIWLVTNRKKKERKGKVQLIDATKHYRKMKPKSLGNKRNELTDEHISEITRLYAKYKDDDVSKFECEGEKTERIASKIFNNRDFGYLKVTVERPLQLNFQASTERIERLKSESAFESLAVSKKRKVAKIIKAEEKAGQEEQEQILSALGTLSATKLYKNRDAFTKDLVRAFNTAKVTLDTSMKKAILSALSEQDDTADICMDAKGNPEPDTTLRDTELVPLPKDIPLPLPLGYDAKDNNAKLIKLVKDHCEGYLKKEVLPHVPGAWIDYDKIKVGYEIPLNRHFYVYRPPRELLDIEKDIKALEKDIVQMLQGIAA